MDSGQAVRIHVVSESQRGDQVIRESGHCHLVGIFCATVGQAGEPETPEPTTPTVDSMTPTEGINGTVINIVGSGFGPGGAGAGVSVGDETATVQSWSDTNASVAVVRGSSPTGTPLPVVLTTADGQDVPCGEFSVTPTEGTDALRGGRSNQGQRDMRKPDPREKSGGPYRGKGKTGTRPDADTRGAPSMPTFESGAGIMVRNGNGSKVLIGPFELKPGQWHPLPLECADGLEVVTSGLCDVSILYNTRYP